MSRQVSGNAAAVQAASLVRATTLEARDLTVGLFRTAPASIPPRCKGSFT